MKKFLVILLFIYGANLSYAKQCISKRSTETGESKYTEQHSIETNISGHKLRIFTLVVNPKSSKKNCDGLKVYSGISIIIFLMMNPQLSIYHRYYDPLLLLIFLLFFNHDFFKKKLIENNLIIILLIYTVLFNLLYSLKNLI